jgi:serine/threonine protein kinase
VQDLSARPQMCPPAKAIPAIGDLVSGKYRVDGTAGTGGMGVVLSATHVELGHRVAIKVLASEEETDSVAVERFLREGKAAASLQSDHVVRIYDVGRLESGMPFMVMELLRGQDLGTFILTTGIIETTQAVDWILQACNAIAEAHANGIIHRDLKPSNLFLTHRSDGSDCVKVLDFGISKRVATPDDQVFQGGLTATRQVVGSPAYMSPEQVRNSRDIDHRVDIWALGMTLYECLAGRPAFNADTFPAVCAAIVADSPPPLREVAANIPDELDQIVLRCLEKDPTRRFASVNELASALQSFGSARSVGAARSRPQPSNKKDSGGRPIESSTLASARSPNQSHGAEPISRVRLDEESATRTLLSNRHDDAAMSRAGATPLSRLASRQIVWLLLAAIGFAVGVAWKIRYAASSRPPPLSTLSQVVTPVRSAQFAVRFESEPTGAEVWEGDKLLGVTPLSFAVAHSSVANRPKAFVLRTDGYAPFAINQSDSEQDVSIVAHLSPLPSAPTTANVTGTPVVKGAPKQAHPAANPAVKRGASPQSETAPVLNDIRTRR